MDLRKIKKLIDLLEESNLAELEIKEGEESVRLSRNITGAAPVVYAPAPAAAPTPPRGAEPVMPMQSPVDAATGGRAPPAAVSAAARPPVAASTGDCIGITGSAPRGAAGVGAGA